MVLAEPTRLVAVVTQVPMMQVAGAFPVEMRSLHPSCEGVEAMHHMVACAVQHPNSEAAARVMLHCHMLQQGKIQHSM